VIGRHTPTEGLAGRQRGQAAQASTLRSRDSILRNHVRPLLDEIRPEDLTQERVERGRSNRPDRRLANGTPERTITVCHG